MEMRRCENAALKSAQFARKIWTSMKQETSIFLEKNNFDPASCNCFKEDTTYLDLWNFASHIDVRMVAGWGGDF